ncbi:MAG TPA: OmpA family protein [Verrucomicrobiae bacterium]|nr:OmpA family protein [Verrucomicrobiae bacterium]
MRTKILAQVVLMAFIAAFGLTGCKNPPWKKGTSGGGGLGAESPIAPLGPGGETSVGPRPMVGEGGLPQSQFQPVYFDYDSARIKPSEDSKLEAVATYMKSNPGKLVIEGYCDERGTAEYNRALGERRALAAREQLIKLGVDPSRMSTISYGKDRPVDLGHDEAAWAKNRRDEFVVVNQ